MNKDVASNTIDYPSDTVKAANLADRAEALARELLTLSSSARKQVVESFISRDWTPEEIKAILGSVSIRILRRLIHRKMSRSAS